MTNKKTAIILGATGLTGGLLLQNLLNDSNYGLIKIFGRRKVQVSDSKVEQHEVDLFKLEDYSHMFTGDEVYCCIGTTKKKTPDKDTYRRIDHGIPVAAAKLCKKNNIDFFSVISSMGANKESKFFYNRVKGEMETDVLKVDIPNTYILQPSLIMGERDESRPMEYVGQQLMKFVNKLLPGKLRKYRSIDAQDIADAMGYLGYNGYKSRIIESDEIMNLAEKYRVIQ